MSVFKKIKEFLFPFQDLPKELRKTLKDLDVLDSVWILDSDKTLLEGWIFDVNKKHIIVAIPLGNGKFIDYRFSVTKPLNQEKLIQNNKVLFFNKPCMSEISSFFQ